MPTRTATHSGGDARTPSGTGGMVGEQPAQEGGERRHRHRDGTLDRGLRFRDQDGKRHETDQDASAGAKHSDARDSPGPQRDTHEYHNTSSREMSMRASHQVKGPIGPV